MDSSDRTLHPFLVFRSRSARAPTGDKFTDLVNQLSLLGRVSNGIALQSVLTSGSVPVDDAIRELLHMGPLTLQQLLSMDDKLKKAMETIKKFLNKLDTSAHIAETEKRLVKLEAAQKVIAKTADIGELEEKDTFKTDLENALKIQIVEADVTAFLLALTSLKGDLNKIQTWDSDVATRKEKTGLEQLFFSLEDFEKAVVNIDSTASQVQSMKKLEASAVFMQYLIDDDEMRKSLVKVGLDPSEIKAAVRNFETFRDSAAVFKEVVTLIPQIQKFLHARYSKDSGAMEVSAGLPNGADDLDKWSADVDDEWFQKISELPKDVLKELQMALNPLTRFKTSMKTVDSKWELTGQEATQHMFQTITSIQIEMASREDDAKEGFKKLTELRECDKDLHLDSVPDVGKIEDGKKAVFDLQGRLEALSGLDYLEPLKNMTVLKSAVNITKVKEHEDEAVLKAVRDLKGPLQTKVNETISLLDKLSQDLGTIKTFFIEFPKLATSVKDTYTAIDNYHDEVKDIGHLGFMDCMRNVTTDGDYMEDWVKTLNGIREKKKLVNVDDAVKVVDSLLEARSLLKATRMAGNELKGKEHNKLLEKLREALKNARELGMAARGLRTIQKLLAERKNLEPLFGDVTYIEKAANDAKNELSQEDFDMLKTFDNVTQKMIRLYSEIDSYVQFIRQVDYQDFKSYGKALNRAEKINEVSIDSKGLRRAVEALLKKVAPKKSQKRDVSADLSGVVGALKLLEQLHLAFSNYNFSLASSALDVLKSFFTDISIKMTTSGPPPPPPRTVPTAPPTSSKPHLGNAQQTSSLAAQPESDNTMMIVYICLGVGGFIAFVIVVYCCCFRKKNKGSAVVSASSEQLLNETPTTAGEGVTTSSTSTVPVAKKPEKSKIEEASGSPPGTTSPTTAITTVCLAMERVANMWTPVGNSEHFLSGIERNLEKKRPPRWKVVDGAKLDCAKLGGANWIMSEERDEGVLWNTVDRQNIGILVCLQSETDFLNRVIIQPWFFSMKIGEKQFYDNYQVTLMSNENVEGQFDKDDNVKAYRVSYVNRTLSEEKRTSKNVIVLLCSQWNLNDYCPEKVSTSVNILKYCEFQNKNVWVMDRTLSKCAFTLTGIQLGYSRCLNKKGNYLETVIREMLALDSKSIKNGRQVLYMAATIGMLASTIDPTKFCASSRKLLFYADNRKDYESEYTDEKAMAADHKKRDTFVAGEKEVFKKRMKENEKSVMKKTQDDDKKIRKELVKLSIEKKMERRKKETRRRSEKAGGGEDQTRKEGVGGAD